MKKQNKIMLFVMTLLIITINIFVLYFSFNKLRADAGFDISYDSDSGGSSYSSSSGGSSSIGSSSYDNDYGYDSNSTTKISKVLVE